MVAALIVSCIILFLAHVYFYDMSLAGRKKSETAFSLYRRYFSIKYAMPLTINPDDSPTEMKFKRYANYTLYGFYISFALIMVFAATHTGSIF
jgi:hypothetical protein